jgi:hypothetical protein
MYFCPLPQAGTMIHMGLDRQPAVTWHFPLRLTATMSRCTIAQAGTMTEVDHRRHLAEVE